MSTILDEIIAHKRNEVAARRELYPLKLLERELFFSAQPVSLRDYLKRSDQVGVIAEIKRRSPSKGVINQHISIEDLSIGYMQAGASALSVLTDSAYFGGSEGDLKIARRCNYCPILRKDFVVDEYQVIEAKAIGADVVLLIAAALSPEQARQLGRLARSLGLEVLLEVHSAEELGTHLDQSVSIVGVNNRDLRDFSVSLDRARSLYPAIPKEMVAIAESGISDPLAIVELKQLGYRGFLIGEAFMRHTQPERACERLIGEVKRLYQGDSE
jgi:indole-3-glycerol phosphate synthase